MFSGGEIQPFAFVLVAANFYLASVDPNVKAALRMHCGAPDQATIDNRKDRPMRGTLDGIAIEFALGEGTAEM